ncbi:hypothetical protein M3Y99_01652800 [Aphelenchoides fujianensis]|nr:hypothetical protein M3Y99_01652800 [Aphelenchoides fujianensis]
MEKQMQTTSSLAKPNGKNEVRGRNKVSAAADAAIAAFVQATVQAGVEGLRREFAEIKGYMPATPACTAFSEPANEARNRYKDVVCLDQTRVVLTLNVPPETDYVHANFVKMEGVDRVFIAAQGPLEGTTADFWRMVYQESVSTILMLSRCEEAGKIKCFQYWPTEQGAYKNYGAMFTEQRDRFITFTLEVLPDGCSNSCIVHLIQMVDWPDRGVPTSGMSVLRLLKMLPKNKHAGPTVIHCSAGIGRTGTIMCVETAISRLWKGQAVEVCSSAPLHPPTRSLQMKKVVCELRDRRASMVQTEGQFVFAHLVVLCYINVSPLRPLARLIEGNQAKMPKHRSAVMEFYEQFRQAQLN